MRTIISKSNICYKCQYSHSFKPYLICEKRRKYVECFDCCSFFKKDKQLIYDEKRISNLTMENLAITKLCLEEILQDKIELENENDLEGYVSNELHLSIKNLKGVIEIVDEKLEDYR